ncbi:hypothetical protein ACFW9X_43730 [Streptomyces sp. NPDC059466]
MNGTGQPEGPRRPERRVLLAGGFAVAAAAVAGWSGTNGVV